MFYGCNNLNIDHSPTPPDLSQVTDMSNMFSGCSSLNGPRNIGNWDVSNVTNMEYIFGFTSSFNQPLENWNTSNVTNMSSMFSATTYFNQPIDNWDVSNVTDMSDIFSYTSSFNQPLAHWKLNPKVELFHIFYNTGMDCDNYSATLIGWERNNPYIWYRSLVVSGLKYGTNAVAARDALINQGWTIDGDTPSGTICGTTATEDTYQSKTTVYPNPSYDIIYVDGLDGSNKYTLHSLTGQVVKTGIIDANNPGISIYHLNAGIYILKVETHHGTEYHRLVKTE